MFIYILVFSYICGTGVTLIIVGELVCRDRLTHRGPSHQLLDELSYSFTTLDGFDTPSVGLWHNTLGSILTQGVVKLRLVMPVHLKCIERGK